MRKRDFLKKKAKQTGDSLIWQQYKHSRNSTNNEIKRAKSLNILRLTLRLIRKIQNQPGNLLTN
jgi:Tfp pilus assembly ATPase PilU